MTLRRHRDPAADGSRKRAHRAGVALAVLVALVTGLMPAAAQEGLPQEVEVKAAFLFKLFQFVDWPEPVPAGARFRLGVLGEGPIVPVLEALDGREVRGRRLEVRHFRDLGELDDCHILYVAGAADQLAEILTRLDGASTLLAGDRKSFAGRGGVIGFYLDQKRLRLAINVEAARRAGLTISSKLLRLATVYRGEGDGQGA